MTGPAPEVVKWYTRARKFPQLIGRTPDGTRIWGGPYTFTQVVGAGVVLLAAVNTMGLWAQYGLLGNAALLLGVTYGVVLLLGRMPVGSRNPLAVLSGTLSALTAPRTGRIAGQRVQVRRPHRVRHRITVLLETAQHPAPAPEPTPSAATAPPPAPLRPMPSPAGTSSLLTTAASRATAAPSPPALTGVQATLARASSGIPRRT